MIRNRAYIAATTVIIAFFLTFLGMRLSFLDKSPRPKAKPRAVLNLSGKAMNSSTGAVKDILTPVAVEFCETVEYRTVVHPLRTSFPVAANRPVLPSGIKPDTGRSPPIA